MGNPVRGVQKTESRLLVERRVVGKPQHHCARIRLELVVRIAVEQRLDHSCRHHGLACAGGRRQRERGRRLQSLPVLPAPGETVQHVGDGIVLVILQRVQHDYDRPELIVKLLRYDS